MGSRLYRRYRDTAMKVYESKNPTSAKEMWAKFLAGLTPSEKLRVTEWVRTVRLKRKPQVAAIRRKIDQIRHATPEFKGAFIFGSFMKGKMSPDDLDLLLVIEVSSGTWHGAKHKKDHIAYGVHFEKEADKNRHYETVREIKHALSDEQWVKELGLKPKAQSWHIGLFNKELLPGMARQIIELGISPSGFIGDPAVKKAIRQAYEKAIAEGATKNKNLPVFKSKFL